jgi:hypothetical protein
MPDTQPRYVFNLQVTCRRISGDPLRTSLENLFEFYAELSAPKGYRLLKDVELAAKAAGEGIRVLSQSQLTVLQQLILDAKTE